MYWELIKIQEVSFRVLRLLRNLQIFHFCYTVENNITVTTLPVLATATIFSTVKILNNVATVAIVTIDTTGTTNCNYCNY